MKEKKLIKSSDRIICGVCGGFAEYFGIDPLFLRLGFLAFALAGGSGVLLYIAASILMPEPGETDIH